MRRALLVLSLVVVAASFPGAASASWEGSDPRGRAEPPHGPERVALPPGRAAHAPCSREDRRRDHARTAGRLGSGPVGHDGEARPRARADAPPRAGRPPRPRRASGDAPLAAAPRRIRDGRAAPPAPDEPPGEPGLPGASAARHRDPGGGGMVGRPHPRLRLLGSRVGERGGSVLRPACIPDELEAPRADTRRALHRFSVRLGWEVGARQTLFGVTSRGGFDCSGFAWRVYKTQPYAGAPRLGTTFTGARRTT